MFIKKIAITCVMSLMMISSIFAETLAPPIDDIKAAYSLLEEKNYSGFYQEWCHSHVKQQVSESNFIKHMEGPKGKEIVKLYSTVLALNLEKSPTMQFGPQDEDEYHFRLSNTEELEWSKRKGGLCHLELKLEGEKWKLKDTD